ncbi:NADP-dependent oxidoreductase [Lentilactobacillus kefiri]|uniref:Alcohol dehydrogenase zinc-binding domain-containing protein n=3 Tax=Bacilli TaxID=91061 RepID=A0A8E1RKI5_LENKE|nr:NADP-dependent oxidoreductase [Lentilactobacillus kefiri]KRL72302.1 alcohol dehydrogenase zinc-binding domain-containing protein [Lentilactobacillus parakefiri DSM 10551]KRM53949.1 alcohol dehydrogenase zinc-binding domain-containing protein [Lentilactobacillus kefiri DSM 20587 = JCM 5818]MCJ2161360.1 NADP-dependent oxidoreductase [Lentilactobacillus kefiri]MCP9368843.1 NADP-dependent oxidoreductase [Lentilactobacillus kefiri]MDH5108669.1 NADP-dependent oxidoreductase [Lentilactobacillus ke
MKAFGYEKHGAPEVFQEYDVPEPTISADQVLIQTIAVGLNNRERAEWENGRSTTSPYIPGRDVVGEIVKVGDQVSDLSVGQTVMTHTEHGYAEYVVGDLDATVVVSDGLTPTRAVGLITPGLTAYKAVKYFADVKPGQTVIVKGASGGVGSLSVQIATDLGAQVIGIASSHNEAYVKSIGAVKFVAYDQTDPAEELADTGDVVLNMAMNGAGTDDDIKMVKPNGVIASVAHQAPTTDKALKFVHIFPTNAMTDREAMQAVIDLMRDGKLDIKIGYTLPFTRAGFVKGHQLLEEKHDGRVVIIK